jgi:hypothetical protein
MPTPAKKIPFPAPFNAPEGTLSVDAEPTLDGIANLLPEQGGLKPLYINPIGSLMTRGDLEEIILKTHEEALRFTRPEDPLYVKGSGAEFYPSLRWKNVWRVTGFRIDPCFGRLGAKSNDERYNSQNPFDALNNMKIRQDMEQDLEWYRLSGQTNRGSQALEEFVSHGAEKAVFG